MKETNVERVISNFVMSKTYHPKTDKLRINESGAILDSGLRIGQFEEGQVGEVWMKFLRLSLEDHFASWKKYKKQLANEANKWGIVVVFEKYFDIGFGENDLKAYFYSSETLFEDLLKVARYSQDKDLQTAACASIVDSRWPWPDHDDIVAYSYNQLLNEDTILHAEKAVAFYYQYIIENKGTCPTPMRWLTMLQPCEHCLQRMLDAGASAIIYGYPHKDKWNTAGYFEIVEKIMSKDLRHKATALPILYHKTRDENTSKKIEKFYRRKSK